MAKRTYTITIKVETAMHPYEATLALHSYMNKARIIGPLLGITLLDFKADYYEQEENNDAS